MTRRWKVALVVLSAVACTTPSAHATVVVGFVDQHTVASLGGGSFTVDIVADISDDVFGWGIDLEIATPGVVQLDSITINSMYWTEPGSSDDGLAGIAVPPGASYSGADLLLCTLEFTPLALGSTGLHLSDDYPSDLTEGWPLDPTGFDADVTYIAGSITIVPEPTALTVLAFGGLFMLGHRRRANQQRT